MSMTSMVFYDAIDKTDKYEYRERVRTVALPSYFHFAVLEEKVSRAKGKFVSSYLGILYLAPGILNRYLNFKLRRPKIVPLAPRNQFLWRQLGSM